MFTIRLFDFFVLSPFENNNCRCKTSIIFQFQFFWAKEEDYKDGNQKSFFKKDMMATFNIFFGWSSLIKWVGR
jgi:hypothetical protein